MTTRATFVAGLFTGIGLAGLVVLAWASTQSQAAAAAVEYGGYVC